MSLGERGRGREGRVRPGVFLNAYNGLASNTMPNARRLCDCNDINDLRGGEGEGLGVLLRDYNGLGGLQSAEEEEKQG